MSDSAGSTPAWEEPIPLSQIDVPPFPTATLPEWLRALVEAESIATQTPPDLTAMLALSVCAYAASKKLVVRANAGYCEPLNLFTVVALPPANRKSAVFRDVAAPLELFEQEEARRSGPQIAEALSRDRIAQEQLKSLEREAANGSPERSVAAQQEAARLATEVAGQRIPVAPRCVVDDCSPERLTTLLRDHNGRIAVLAPEGDVFDMMAGRYSASGMANFGVFVRGHAGDDLRVDRVHREPDLVLAPALTMGLAVQPEIIRGLMKNEGFRGRGLLGRFLYSAPKSTLGLRDAKAPPVPDLIRQAYLRGVDAILRWPFEVDEGGNISPRELILDDLARLRLVEFQEWLEPMLGEFGELGFMSDWAGKLVGAVLRIAGILCATDRFQMAEPWAQPVGVEIVERAIQIGHYLIPHARAAYGEMGGDPVIGDATYLLRWILHSERIWFSKRDLHQATKGRFKTIALIEPALALLEDHGYLRQRTQEKEVRAGRPSSPVYDLNPLVRGHNSHNPQYLSLAARPGDCEGIEDRGEDNDVDRAFGAGGAR